MAVKNQTQIQHCECMVFTIETFESNRLFLKYFASISQHWLGKLLGRKNERFHLQFQPSTLCMPASGSFSVKMFVRYGPSWLNDVKRLHSFYTHNYSKALWSHDLFLLFQKFKLSPEQLSMLIECKLSGKMSYPKEMWKLFFTKFSANLGNALHMLSNTVKTMAHSQSAVW